MSAEHEDLDEVDAALNALHVAGGKGKIHPREGVCIVLKAAREYRNAARAIPAALRLDEMAMAAIPEVGKPVFVIVDDEVRDGLVLRYIQSNDDPPSRVRIAASWPTNQAWWDAGECFASAPHAHLALAQIIEDARLVTMESVIDLEKQRDEHLAAANDLSQYANLKD